LVEFFLPFGDLLFVVLAIVTRNGAGEGYCFYVVGVAIKILASQGFNARQNKFCQILAAIPYFNIGDVIFSEYFLDEVCGGAA
jgi:hypothetical protein